MKKIDERYIEVLDQFGFGLYTTKAGCSICRDSSWGSYIVNFNGDDFVEMFIDYAETFDPNAYVSLLIESHRGIKDIGEMLKSVKEIQILLLKAAIEFVKISKERMIFLRRCGRGVW